MKRNGILNSDISRVLSYLGHTDQICIGDCGLPIPDETERIDLALRFGQPCAPVALAVGLTFGVGVQMVGARGLRGALIASIVVFARI